MKSKRRLTAIVKTTTKCNLNCSYCYEIKKDNDMDDMTLKNTIEKIAKFNGPESITEIIWHGGEPLSREINFFEKAVEYQKNLGVEYRFSNKIQTNATLLNEDFANFFKENNFILGVSIDGPAEFHNKTRLSKQGNGTFDSSLRGIELARNKEILGGGICVVSKVNLDNLSEVYNFFREQKLNVKLSPIFKSINSWKYFSEIGINAKDYGIAMANLFDIWWKEKDNQIRFDPFEQIIKGFLTKQPIGCNYRRTCHENYLSIAPSGETYPCGRFSGFNEFILGNINVKSIEELQNSFPKKKIKNRFVKECEPCEYKVICNGGCPLTAYISNKDINSKSEFCIGDKILFSHIKKRLLEEL